MHRNAPLAKIVIICPLFYLLDRNQAAHGASGINSAFLSVMKLFKWCYDGWIENRDAADWLSWESFSYDPDKNTWLTDTSVLDTDPNSPNYGGYFDFRQINPRPVWWWIPGLSLRRLLYLRCAEPLLLLRTSQRPIHTACIRHPAFQIFSAVCWEQTSGSCPAPCNATTAPAL